MDDILTIIYFIIVSITFMTCIIGGIDCLIFPNKHKKLQNVLSKIYIVGIVSILVVTIMI